MIVAASSRKLRGLALIRGIEMKSRVIVQVFFAFLLSLLLITGNGCYYRGNGRDEYGKRGMLMPKNCFDALKSFALSQKELNDKEKMIITEMKEVEDLIAFYEAQGWSITEALTSPDLSDDLRFNITEEHAKQYVGMDFLPFSSFLPEGKKGYLRKGENAYSLWGERIGVDIMVGKIEFYDLDFKYCAVYKGILPVAAIWYRPYDRAFQPFRFTMLIPRGPGKMWDARSGQKIADLITILEVEGRYQIVAAVSEDKGMSIASGGVGSGGLSTPFTTAILHTRLEKDPSTGGIFLQGSSHQSQEGTEVFHRAIVSLKPTDYKRFLADFNTPSLEKKVIIDTIPGYLKDEFLSSDISAIEMIAGTNEHFGKRSRDSFTQTKGTYHKFFYAPESPEKIVTDTHTVTIEDSLAIDGFRPFSESILTSEMYYAGEQGKNSYKSYKASFYLDNVELPIEHR